MVSVKDKIWDGYQLVVSTYPVQAIIMRKEGKDTKALDAVYKGTVGSSQATDVKFIIIDEINSRIS